MRAVGVALASLALVGCGATTEEEAVAFLERAQAEIPYMAQYQDPDEYRELADAICDDLGQSEALEEAQPGIRYRQASEVAAAYLDLPPSVGEVDQVVALAVSTSCPDAQAAIDGA